MDGTWLLLSPAANPASAVTDRTPVRAAHAGSPGQLRRQSFGPLSGNVHDQNPGAGRGQDARGRLSDSAGPARDQRYFAINAKRCAHR